MSPRNPPLPYGNDPTPYGENDTFPERQINSAQENITLRLFGDPIKATGGFMEPYGHGYKSNPSYYIDSSDPDQIKRIDPGRYNIGVDYVVTTPEQDANNWYSGIVSRVEPNNGGYGKTVYIDSDVEYVLNGQSYPVKLAYAHLDEIDPAMIPGEPVEQGQRVGEMGGTGTTPNAYPEHVDFRAWIEVPRADGQGNRVVYVSPDALSQNLLQQQYGVIQASAQETQSPEALYTETVGQLQEAGMTFNNPQEEGSAVAAVLLELYDSNVAGEALASSPNVMETMDSEGFEAAANQIYDMLETGQNLQANEQTVEHVL